MRIDYFNGGFVEILENNVIEKVVCYYNGISKIYFYDRPPKELVLGCSSYNSQYGIPVSRDGRKLFIGSWEKNLGGLGKGLYAYDIMSGSKLWELSEGKIRDIFVYIDYLIVLKANASVYKLDINNGKVLTEIKSGSIEKLFDLSGSYILVNSIKDKLSVVDTENMSVIRNYGQKVVNPEDCLSLLIQNAVLQGTTLTVSGIENYPNKNYNVSPPRSFIRIIDENFECYK